MEFRLFNIDDIDHTRIIKFLHNFYIKDSYQIKKVGIPSSNEYIIKFISGTDTASLSKYLKSQRYDFTLRESKQFSLAEVAKKILTENANLYKKLMQKVSKLTGDQTAEDIFKKYTEKYINHPSYSNDNIQANLILLSTKEMQDMMDDLDYVY